MKNLINVHTDKLTFLLFWKRLRYSWKLKLKLFSEKEKKRRIGTKFELIIPHTFIRCWRIVRLRGSSCCVGESGTKVVAREEDLCEVWSSEKDRQEKAAKWMCFGSASGLQLASLRARDRRNDGARSCFYDGSKRALLLRPMNEHSTRNSIHKMGDMLQQCILVFWCIATKKIFVFVLMLDISRFQRKVFGTFGGICILFFICLVMSILQGFGASSMVQYKIQN